MESESHRPLPFSMASKTEPLSFPRRHRIDASLGDHRETGGQAAMAVGGNESLAGWNLCPYSEPNAPL